MSYKHIFFDLDRTLWDFDANSYETLLELCEMYSLKDKGIADYDEFIKIYKAHNDSLWDLYRVNKISQEDLRRERFQRVLADYKVDDYILSEKMGNDYVELCPRKSKLYPFAIEVLQYLKEKYSLHIITNGFDKTQHIKLDHANLRSYFINIVTSEKLGVKKPDPRIFEYALDIAGSTSKEALYIGDNLSVDILGCQNSGIDGVYFNPQKSSHSEDVRYEISCLSQLKEIL